MAGQAEATLAKTMTNSTRLWQDDKGNSYVRVSVKANSGVATAATSGSMTAMAANVYGMPEIAGYDLSSNALANIPVSSPDLMYMEVTLLNAVTASGAGNWVDVIDYNNLTFYYISTASGTTSTLQVEASPDQTNVAVLDIETVATAQVDTFSCLNKHRYVRGNLTADGGGSHTIKMVAGR